MKTDVIKELSEDEKQILQEDIRCSQKQRLQFIDLWAKYVLEHEDRDWSRQQNVIINSCLRNSPMTKELYLKMKGEMTR